VKKIPTDSAFANRMHGERMAAARPFGTGGLTARQAQALIRAARTAECVPSYLSDLEGAGPVGSLERSMQHLLGVRHVLAVSSGTAALHAALLAMGIGPGDEVIVSPYTWGQSVAPVLFTGATAVFADIDPDSLCLEPRSVSERISRKTKAVVPVHLFGHTADMASLGRIAEARGISLVADAAHSLGATLAGRTTAQWGHAACFSLGRGKLVSGGEGGLLATDDTGLYERAVQATQHQTRLRRELRPTSEGLWTDDLAHNYRIHPLAAVLALADMEILEKRLAHRRSVWFEFQEGSGEIPFVTWPQGQPSECWAAYGIPLGFISNQCGVSREHFAAVAQKAGIPVRCGPVRIPIHLRPTFRESAMGARPRPPRQEHPTHQPGSCPVAERRCKRQELWVLSTVDMDGLTPAEAHNLGRRLKRICEKMVPEVGGGFTSLHMD